MTLAAEPTPKTDSSTVSLTAEATSTPFRPWDACPRAPSPPPAGPGPSSPMSPEVLSHKKIRKVLLAPRGPSEAGDSQEGGCTCACHSQGYLCSGCLSFLAGSAFCPLALLRHNVKKSE